MAVAAPSGAASAEVWDDCRSIYFLSRDPAVATTRSPYGYVHDNPLNSTDPTGLGCSWNPLDWGNCVSTALSHVRAPDYITLDLSGSIPFLPSPITGGIQITYSKSGHLFVGPEAGVGIPGFSGALRGGWINQGSTPSCSQTDNFISGFSVTGSGYAPIGDGVVGPAGAVTWGNPGQFSLNATSTELGVGVGAGHNISVQGSYAWQLPGFQGPGW